MSNDTSDHEPQHDGHPHPKQDSTQPEQQSGPPQHVSMLVMALIREMMRPPLFPLGQIAITPAAIDLLDRTGTNASTLLARHQHGDWGDIDADDARTNQLALQHGGRILSVYVLGDRQEPLWVLTEADRRVTTLLLAGDY